MYRYTKSAGKLLLSVSVCTLLAACQTSQPVSDGSVSSIDSAIQRAAMTTAERSGSTGSLSYLESKYKRDSEDAQTAINYASALRDNQYINRAELVLAPFANDPESPSNAKAEYAAVQLEQGNYKSTEQYAQKAVLQDEGNYKAYHFLGIALDAQGMHEEAERAFRKALDHWQGDPTTVMNNLALNLASQNYLDEAIEILRKAQSVSPNRMEIERNLRIVTALQQSSGGHNAPKPTPKPEMEDLPG